MFLSGQKEKFLSGYDYGMYHHCFGVWLVLHESYQSSVFGRFGPKKGKVAKSRGSILRQNTPPTYKQVNKNNHNIMYLIMILLHNYMLNP